MLRGHPDLCLVQVKEAHFFNDESLFGGGMALYEEQFFSHHRGEPVIGDMTPAYHLPRYMKRISETLGRDIKLSICFRFPLARSFSHYFFDVKLLGQQPLPFEEAIEKESDYIEASLGGRSLENIFRLFPRENVLPLIFERDIKKNGAQIGYEKIADFLGLSEYSPLPEPRGAGFLPHITVAKRDGRVQDDGVGAAKLFRQEFAYAQGDIVIETLQNSTDYKVQVIQSPDSETRRFYEGYYDNVTRLMEREEIRSYYDRLFAEDVDLLRTLLDDDIPEWDLDNYLSLSSPPILETRL